MDRPLRVALIGCGTVARRQHVPGFRAAPSGTVDVTVFSSRSPEAAVQAAAAWGGGAVVTDWREAVARADVDAVDICTPNATHAEIALAAIGAGKHVMVEKPIATSVQDADAMVTAADEAGVVLMTAHSGRYGPSVQAAAQAVRRGIIGEVTGVESYLAHGGPRLWAPSAAWFFESAAAGGGALLDLGVHAVDNVRFVTGDEIVEVAAMVTDIREGLEFDGQLVFRLGGGALGFVKGSWNAPYGNPKQMVVWGREAQLVVGRRHAAVRRPGGAEDRVPDAPAQDLYADFVRACTGAPGPGPSGADGRAALAVVLASYASARQHTFVPLA